MAKAFVVTLTSQIIYCTMMIALKTVIGIFVDITLKVKTSYLI